MYRELRISILIVLISFVYGLTSLFSSGEFVTPFFFSKIILIATSLLFFLLNFREKKSWLLLLAFFAMGCYGIGDEATVNLLTKGGTRTELFNFLNSQLLITVSFFYFFAFYYISLYLLYKEVNVKWMVFGLASLITASILLIAFQWYQLFQIVFSIFLLIYFVIVFRKNLPEKAILNSLSALFLLQFLLELFKYLL